MVLSREKSAALMVVLVLIFILTILSSVILSVLSNQTRVIEHSISRTKAKYANEAAMVRELERLRKGYGLGSSHKVSGRYDRDNEWTVDISNLSGVLNFSTDYTSSP